LKFLINDCISIENEIKDINEMIKKIISEKNIEVKFSPEDEVNDKISKEIKKFGEIRYNKK